MIDIITINDLDKWNCCCRDDGEQYCDDALNKKMGKGKTPLGIANMRCIPTGDRLWVLLRREVLGKLGLELILKEIVDYHVRKNCLHCGIPEVESWAKEWLLLERPFKSAAWSAAESAWSAAWSAAESAWSAARSAGSAESAGSAAWSAAWSAAESAWSAARSAAESAGSAGSAESAWSAAWSAAESAWSAAWSAAESAESAARSAEEKRQLGIIRKALKKGD